MKKKLLLIVFLLASIFCFAQEGIKPTIVVVPFDVKNVSSEEVEVLFEVFQSELANTGKAKIVDRSSFEKISKLQEFENSDWSDTDKIAEMGKALNANLVVTGQIMNWKNELVTTIKLIDVNTTEIVSSVVERTQDTDVLFNKLSEIAKKLSEQMSNPISKTVATVEESKLSKIGDRGEGGGIIFYVSEPGFLVDDGQGNIKLCHYLEVAELPIGKRYWTPKGHSLYLGEIHLDGIGQKANTYSIIKKSSYTNSIEFAAGACYRYRTETSKENEWYMPTSTELSLIRKNLPEVTKSWGNNKVWVSDNFYSDRHSKYNSIHFSSSGGYFYELDIVKKFDYQDLYLLVCPVRAY